MSTAKRVFAGKDSALDLMAWGITFSKWLLVGFSVISVAVILERVIQLGRITTSENTDYKKLREAAASGNTAPVQSVAANSSSPVALSLAQGLSAPVLALGRERLRESVGRGITTQTAFLQNNLQYLATIASTAPYIGLFGTVLGILGAFRQIAATGETGPAVVSGSISEALITTALGLGVAIPAAIGYNLLLARVNAMSLTVENHALEVADLIADHDPQEGA